MIKRFIIVMTFAASCAVPATGQSEARVSIRPTNTAAVRQLDQAKRAWLGLAVSHILGDDTGPSGAR